MGNDCNHDCDNCVSQEMTTFEDMLHELIYQSSQQGVGPEELIVCLASASVNIIHQQLWDLSVQDQDEGMERLILGMRSHLAGLQAEAIEGPKQ